MTGREGFLGQEWTDRFEDLAARAADVRGYL
jgi:hypothetical protein